jgi:pimeloyl-ACP methyl ester carboxylesterase
LAVIVCRSVGCRPVVELAMEQPEKVGRLMLVDPKLGFAADRTSANYGAGHIPYIENTQQFNQVLLKFRLTDHRLGRLPGNDVPGDEQG